MELDTIFKFSLPSKVAEIAENYSSPQLNEFIILIGNKTFSQEIYSKNDRL